MKVYILGICGTFMAGIAQLAKQMGHEVTGCDENVYPPMSTQLESQGIVLQQGYQASHLHNKPDLVVVGNVISRGNLAMEHVLNENMPYVSGPQFLAEYILKDRWVLAVAGTHGKTTTSSMLAWLLEYAGKKPGFLIGGVPQNFTESARLGDAPFFVIEADEYDAAFFDKRSKFVHYHPHTCILNNLEFDHADIFDSLADIEKQFHHLIRTIPGNGCVVLNAKEAHLTRVLAQGCWTPIEKFNDSAAWHAKLIKPDASEFDVFYSDQLQGRVQWSLLGEHNMQNALAAIVAAHHAGVDAAVSIKALAEFKNVRRRLETRGVVNGVTVYDDFAHHPTAIETTIAGLRAKVGEARILAVVELGSYTMRTGVHAERVAKAMSAADQSFMVTLDDSVDNLIVRLLEIAKKGDHILVMSNKGFENMHERLLERLA